MDADSWSLRGTEFGRVSPDLPLGEARRISVRFHEPRVQRLRMRFEEYLVPPGGLYGEEMPLVEAHNQVVRAIGAGLSLLGEAGRGREALESLAACVRGVTAHSGAREASRRIGRRFPGAAALFLAEAAAYGYSHGDYWEAVTGWAGISDPYCQTLWGQRFLVFLQVFGLPIPDVRRHVRGAYVGPILLHAMIPNDCLPGFFGDLLEPAVRSEALAGLGTEELISEWLNRPGFLAAVEQPIEHFLKYGGCVAVAFIRSALQMVRMRYETGALPSHEQAGLPCRVVEWYREWVETEGGQRFPERVRRPFLRLEPGTGVFLELPEQLLPPAPGLQSATWVLCLADRSVRRILTIARNTEDGLRCSNQTYPISPDQAVVVRFEAAGETLGQWEVHGFSPDCPCKAFSERDLREVSLAEPLAPEPMWFVLPSDATVTLDPPSADAAQHDLADLGGNWYGFRAVLIDLSTVGSVRLEAHGRTFVAEVRRSALSVELCGGDLLQPGEFALDTIPTYGCQPPCLKVGTRTRGDTPDLEGLVIGSTIGGPDGRRRIAPCPVDQLNWRRGATAGEAVVDLADMFAGTQGPAEVASKLWHGAGPAHDVRFRWVPGLQWRWRMEGEAFLEVQTPEGSELRLCGAHTCEPQTASDATQWAIRLGENQHFADIELLWRSAATATCSIRLRLEGPRWALLARADEEQRALAWFTRPIESQRRELVESAQAKVLLESRDISWVRAAMRAFFVWATPDTGPQRQQLTVEKTSRYGRWRVLLGPATDTLRRLADQEIHLDLEVGWDAETGTAPTVLTLLRLIPPAPSPTEEPKIEEPMAEAAPEPRVPSPELLDLSSEILCCLGGDFWATVDDLAIDVGAPVQLVRRTVEFAKGNRPYEVLQRGNAICVRRTTTRLIRRDLNQWWRRRHGYES